MHRQKSAKQTFCGEIRLFFKVSSKGADEFDKIYPQVLPDLHALIFRYIHLIALFYVEGFVKLGHVLKRSDHTVVVWSMRVGEDSPPNILIPNIAPPPKK